MSQKLLRMERLRQLMESRGYVSVIDFARSIDKKNSQISDLLRGAIPFGEKLARSIEHNAQLPTGWLDLLSEEGETLYGQTAVHLVTIPFVELSTSEGVKGYAVKNIEKPGQPVFFDQRWLDARGYRPASLYSTEVKDEAMVGKLFKGDVVVYCTDLVTPVDGRAFLVNYESMIMIRRLVRDEGHWWLSADHSDKALYPRKKLTAETEFIGQIVHKQSEVI
jgi:phage repressor protein C with HTH and peptisase S24 domain